MLSRGGEIEIRQFRPEDAESVCELWQRCRWGPFDAGHALSPDDVVRGVEESGTAAFFVALYRPTSRVVGTLTYHPVGSQKAARPGGVWGDDLVVHPEFRNGPVTPMLLDQGMTFCIGSGYRRMDQMAERRNGGALRLYRRAAGRMPDLPACADESVELENHIPGVVRWVYDLGVHEWAGRLPFQGLRQSVASIVPPGRGDIGPDEIAWAGAPAVRYAIRTAWDPSFSCVIDRRLSAVTALTGSLCELDCQPRERRVPAGSSATLACRLTLTAGEPHEVTLCVRDGEGREHWSAAGVLQPGESIQTDVDVRLGPAGLHTFDALAVLLPVGCPPGSPARRMATATWVEAEPAAAAVKGWSVDDGSVRVDVDPATGAFEVLDADRDVVVRELWPEVGPPYPGGVKRAPERDVRLVESDARRIVTKSTGNAFVLPPPAGMGDAVRQALAAVVVRRAVALEGGGVVRVSTEVSLPEDAPALPPGTAVRIMPWAVNTPRTLTVPTDAGLVEMPVVYQALPYMNHNFEHLTEVDLPTDPGRYTAPWSALCDGVQTVAMLWPGAAEVRFGLQWMPIAAYALDGMQPGERRALPDHWLVVTSGGPGAVADACRVRTGRRTPAHATAAPVRLPVDMRIELPAGAGGGVEGVLRPLARKPRTGRLEVEGAGPTGEPVQVAADGHRFSLPLPPMAEAEPGLHHAVLTWRERWASTSWTVPVAVRGSAPLGLGQPPAPDGDDWAVDTGPLQATVAPRLGAAVVALHAGGRDLLSTAYPDLQPVPGGPPDLGGLALTVVPRGRESRGISTGHLLGEAAPDGDVGRAGWEGRAWRGAVLADGARLAWRLAWLASPGLPALVLEATVANDALDPFAGDVVVTARRRLSLGPRFFEYALGDEWLRADDDPERAGRAVACGAGAAGVVHDDVRLVMAAGGRADVRVWRDGRDAHLAAVHRVSLAPGESTRVRVVVEARPAAGWTGRPTGAMALAAWPDDMAVSREPVRSEAVRP